MQMRAFCKKKRNLFITFERKLSPGIENKAEAIPCRLGGRAARVNKVTNFVFNSTRGSFFLLLSCNNVGVKKSAVIKKESMENKVAAAN